MPFYYDVKRITTTNGTADTLSTHLRLLTVANQRSCKLVGLHNAGRDGSAGGGQLRLTTAATAGSGGTTQTPSPREPGNPAAQTTAFDDTTAITAGGTPNNRVTVGWAQTGGHGGWVALDLDHAVTLLANGGANGNAEVGSLADGISQNISPTLEFMEV